MEKAAAPTDGAATIALSVVASLSTALASQVAHATGSSGDPLSTSVPDGLQDISDVVTTDLGVVGSGFSPTLAASLTRETSQKRVYSWSIDFLFSNATHVFEPPSGSCVTLLDPTRRPKLCGYGTVRILVEY